MSGRTIKACPDKIRELAAQGMSKPSIASTLGVTRQRVGQICNRDGIETVSGFIKWEGREALAKLSGRDDITLGKAAEMAGVCETTASEFYRESGLEKPRKRTGGDDLRDLAESGLTLSEAAKALGWRPQLAWNTAKRLGITFKAKYRRTSPEATS